MCNLSVVPQQINPELTASEVVSSPAERPPLRPPSICAAHEFELLGAVKQFERKPRAILYCNSCTRTSHGKDIQHWRHCSYCGARVVKGGAR